MRRIKEYEPRHLTAEQIEQIKELIEINKHIYLDSGWKQSIVYTSWVKLKRTLKKIIRPNGISNAEINTDNAIPLTHKKRFIQSRVTIQEFWLSKQRNIILEELDNLMPTVQEHKHISLGQVVLNLREEIKVEYKRLQDYGMLVDKELNTYSNRSLFFTERYPAIRFKRIIKIEFYNLLLSEYESLQKDGTKAPSAYQHVLIFYYLFEYAKIYSKEDVSDKTYADFVYFISDKSHHNIRKAWGKPLKDNEKELAKDLKAIRPLFEKIKATEILKMIDNDLRG